MFSGITWYSIGLSQIVNERTLRFKIRYKLNNKVNYPRILQRWIGLPYDVVERPPLDTNTSTQAQVFRRTVQCFTFSLIYLSECIQCWSSCRGLIVSGGQVRWIHRFRALIFLKANKGFIVIGTFYFKGALLSWTLSSTRQVTSFQMPNRLSLFPRKSTL